MEKTKAKSSTYPNIWNADHDGKQRANAVVNGFIKKINNL